MISRCSNHQADDLTTSDGVLQYSILILQYYSIQMIFKYSYSYSRLSVLEGPSTRYSSEKLSEYTSTLIQSN